MKKYLEMTEEEQKELYNQFLREPDAFYEKAEMDQLKDALKQNYTERFLTMTRLMKIGTMLSNAKITYSSPVSSNKE